MLPPTTAPLTLIGLDVGTTTTSLMAASVHWMRNCVTGRNELGNVEIIFRPQPVFTPFRGEVKSCGCYYVGARHIQVDPGTYRMRSMSQFARAALADLNIDAEIDIEFAEYDLAKLLDYYVGILEAAVAGRPLPPGEAARLH